jgi:hypothetical protein
MTATCKVCGIPRLLSMTQKWRDGCIVDTTSGAASLCLYEASYPTTLINELESTLGIPLDRIVYLAGTHAAVKVLGVLYETHPRIGSMLFSAPLHRFTENMLVGFGKSIGVADVEITERKRGRRTEVVIRDPFDLSNCLAIISGILQIADGRRISYNILEGTNPYVVEFLPDSEKKGKDEAYFRLFAEDLTPKESHEDILPVCEKCGAPHNVGDFFSFDTDKGMINDRRDGERMIFMGVHGFNSIIRELDRELGSSVQKIFIDFENRSLFSKLKQSSEADGLWEERNLREYLATRGLGFLREMQKQDRSSIITVENAFIAPLVAGRLLAFWAKEHGREGYYNFEVTDNTLRLTIS